MQHLLSHLASLLESQARPDWLSDNLGFPGVTSTSPSMVRPVGPAIEHGTAPAPPAQEHSLPLAPSSPPATQAGVIVQGLSK